MIGLFALPLVLHADGHDDELQAIDHMAMYRPYSGTWESVTKTTVSSEEEPVEFENKGQWVQREILDGAMIEMKGTEQMDGESYSYMWLYGYDMKEQTYVAWFHDQRGLNAKFYGDWSGEEKTMTWTSAEENDQEIFVTIVDDLSDPLCIRFTFKLEDGDGKVLMSQLGKATRSEDE